MAVNTESEIELLARVVLRDRDAFRRLYDATSPRVFSVALSMLNNRVEAEEVLQETYLKVWHSADMFDASRGDPTGWIVSMARNRAIDLIRRRRPEVRIASNAEQTEEVATSGIAERDQRLDECLNALESSQRQSIFAAYFQGLSHSEIATRFAEPIGTIKSRVRRGLIALKGCLEG